MPAVAGSRLLHRLRQATSHGGSAARGRVWWPDGVVEQPGTLQRGSQPLIGAIAILRVGDPDDPFGHTGIVHAVDSTSFVVEEWNYGSSWVDEACAVTDQFGSLVGGATTRTRWQRNDPRVVGFLYQPGTSGDEAAQIVSTAGFRFSPPAGSTIQLGDSYTISATYNYAEREEGSRRLTFALVFIRDDGKAVGTGCESFGAGRSSGISFLSTVTYGDTLYPFGRGHTVNAALIGAYQVGNASGCLPIVDVTQADEFGRHVVYPDGDGVSRRDINLNWRIE